MRAVTHISFSVLSLGLLGPLLHCPLNLLNIIVAGISSLLPDLDTTESTLGKVFSFISKPLDENFGHRTITHSWLGIGGLALISAPIYFFWPTVYLSLILGFASHLIIDCLNKTGIPFFWPSETYFVLPGNPKWRIEVGSKGETILCTLLILGCGLVFYIHSFGFRSLASSFFATPEEAVKEYRKYANTHLMELELSGFHKPSQQAINKQNFAVVNVLGESSFLLDNKKQGLITAGSQATDIIHIDKAVIKKIKTAQIKTQVFRFSGQDLGIMLKELKPGSYLSGKLEAYTRPRYVKEDVYKFSANEYQTISISPGIGEFNAIIEFKNATPEQVKSLAKTNVSGELVSRLVE